MRAISVMFDTLSRRFLSTYGNTWVKTPNFERLNKHCTQFEQFYAGSLPCMPARRELHTGRYNFLHRGWGPLEPFDDSVIEILKKNNIYTHIVTDHNHYWEDGGATYLTRYSSWEGFRGQEGDTCTGIVDPGKIPIPNLVKSARKGKLVETNYANRIRIHKEADYSSVATMQAGIAFIEENYQSDQWLLQIECFDPHEPFLVPQRFLDMYEKIEVDPYFDWPTYGPVCESDEEKRQVIIRYAALISMCDEYLGKVLDVMDRYDMWDDTMFMVNTDHGFLCGEHNWWGKSVQPVYQEIAHLPFYLHIPKQNKETSGQIAQTIDIAPTLLDFFQIKQPKAMLGKSLISLISKDEKIHDAVLFGYFGGHVNLFDGRYVYMRSPLQRDNAPLFEYTLMPTRIKGFIEKDALSQTILCNDFSFLKGMNVLKVPFQQSLNSYYFGNKLFDIKNDYEQTTSINDIDAEMLLLQKMRQLLIENEAPSEQYKRLGLSKEKELGKEEVLQQKEERRNADTIQVAYTITSKEISKLQFIRSVVSDNVYEQLNLQIEQGMKQSQTFDVLLDQIVEKVLQSRNMSEVMKQTFTSFLKHADEIK